MSIVVFGSINLDLVIRVPRHPQPGETLTGHSFFTAPGGKGANQAVACARLNAPTHMVGRVGGDFFGQELRENLIANNVDSTMVIVDESTTSGVAMIVIDDAGENTIVLSPGANASVGNDDLDRLAGLLSTAKILLLQLEISLEIVHHAAEVANQHGITIILDPAPAQKLPEELYPLIDIVTPNETEAAALVDFPLLSENDVKKAAKILRDRGIQNVIIKLGAKGAYGLFDHAGIRIPPFPVDVVDSVAAGDAFNGALAAALFHGKPHKEAIRWAAAGGALAVTKPGAQNSMPDYRSLQQLLSANTNC